MQHLKENLLLSESRILTLENKFKTIKVTYYLFFRICLITRTKGEFFTLITKKVYFLKFVLTTKSEYLKG